MLFIGEDDKILCWPKSKISDCIQREGWDIISSDTLMPLRKQILTAQPIPQCIPSFELSVKLSKIVEGDLVEIGLASEKDEFYYSFQTKDIYHHRKNAINSSSTTLVVNDIARFFLRRVVVDKCIFNICHMSVNNQRVCGDAILQGNYVRPLISIKSPNVEVATSFGFNGAHQDISKFSILLF